jgi:hypothetical protein
MSNIVKNIIWDNDVAFKHGDLPEDDWTNLWDSLDKWWIPYWKITIAIATFWWIVYEILTKN